MILKKVPRLRKEVKMVECPICGEKVEGLVEICPACGFDELNVKKKPKKRVKTSKKKKPSKDKRIILFIIGIIIILVLAIIRLTNNYKLPIRNYYKGLNSQNVDRILRSYHPCLSEDEGFKAKVKLILEPNKLYPDTRYAFTVKKSKLLSEKELKDEQAEYNNACGLNNVRIEEGRVVSIEQKRKITKSADEELLKIDINVGKIAGKWYILE